MYIYIYDFFEPSHSETLLEASGRSLWRSLLVGNRAGPIKFLEADEGSLWRSLLAGNRAGPKNLFLS